MLKALNRLREQTLRQAAAWWRWSRKRPHNRVRRPRIRDERGRRIGYGPPERWPEPPFPKFFCRRVQLPSGAIELELTGAEIQAAYRLARTPMPSAEAVTPLPISEEEIRTLYRESR
jgi:hypothetical protein